MSVDVSGDRVTHMTDERGLWRDKRRRLLLLSSKSRAPIWWGKNGHGNSAYFVIALPPPSSPSSPFLAPTSFPIWIQRDRISFLPHASPRNQSQWSTTQSCLAYSLLKMAIDTHFKHRRRPHEGWQCGREVELCRKKKKRCARHWRDTLTNLIFAWRLCPFHSSNS